jgi:acyl-homoserine-lactone acylase
MRLLIFLVAMALAACAAPTRAAETDLARWEKQARAVTITRDDWGIPHVRGRTDADAVFGVVYAQAEDDFNRIETNYLTAIGRLAEAEGESALYSDLRARLYVNPAEMQRRYAASPSWLKALMEAWADGLNYYLHEHPQVKPRVITRFEPWMPLSFSEGSIGGDIERISLDGLRAFYGGEGLPAPVDPGAALEPDGSNGIAIAPARSASGHALLWINPHTSFFFRAEAQVTSDEGLNAYGAMTWGQFFVYQGFNERLGWMHTSSNVDNIDEYLETVRRRDGGYVYRYGAHERPLAAREIALSYRTAGGMAQRRFTVFRSHHGPIVRAVDGGWVSVRLMDEPVKALMQSWLRTKAKDLASFREVLALHTNSSNNTVYADADGNIGYFHANFVPRRNPRFDWSRPVDGSDPATEWQGVHGFDESPNTINPPGGWVFNTNNWPYTAAGLGTLDKADYPPYMDTGGENPRGIHALRVLEGAPPFTLDTLRDAAFDPWLPAFADLVPALVDAWDRAPPGDPLAARLAQPIALLRAWDHRWSASSVPTTLAVYWGEALWLALRTDPDSEDAAAYLALIAGSTPQQKLAALAAACDRLTADFGTWSVPWGDVNRFQRLTSDIVQRFDDSAPSIPVPFTSSRWGSLASFGYGDRAFRNTRKYYGTSGNSFVAAVEFGERVRAKAISAGGQSGDPASPHFNDQASRYASGALRDVYFHRDELAGHVEREYHPGE